MKFKRKPDIWGLWITYFPILCTFDESQGNSAVSDVIISLSICFFFCCFFLSLNLPFICRGQTYSASRNRNCSETVLQFLLHVSQSSFFLFIYLWCFIYTNSNTQKYNIWKKIAFCLKTSNNSQFDNQKKKYSQWTCTNTHTARVYKKEKKKKEPWGC